MDFQVISIFPLKNSILMISLLCNFAHLKVHLRRVGKKELKYLAFCSEERRQVTHKLLVNVLKI